MNLSDIHLDYKSKLENEIKDLFTGKLNAGIDTVGGYVNRISMLEKQLREINEKIATQVQLDKNVYDTNDGKVKILKIFLASSSELKVDREEFEIFINRQNKYLIDKGLFLHLVIWEDFTDAISATRLQDEYNYAIKKCNLFIGLFFSKVGIFSREEFGVAFLNFKNTGSPLIYTYIKDLAKETKNVSTDHSLEDFKNELRTLGHFPTSYNSSSDLKFHFKMQLDKILPQLLSNV